MANKPPASGYRTPPPSDRDNGSRRQPLFATEVPLLGAVTVDLPLSEPLVVRLNRDRLDLGLGLGLHIHFSTPLPPLDIRKVGLDLHSFEVCLTAESLGPLAEQLVSIGVREVSGRLLGIDPVGYQGPGDSLLSAFLDGLDGDELGRRKFYEAALPLGFDLGVWMAPTSELGLELTGEQLDLTLTQPLVLEAPLIRLGLGGLTYRFSDGHLLLRERTPDAMFLRRWFNVALIFVLGFYARRMLRSYLPPTMATPGYNLFTDPDLKTNLAALRSRLQPQSARADDTASRRMFADLFEAGLTCDEPPAGARVLHRLSPRPGINLAVCSGELAVHVEKDATHVGVAAPAGIFVHCDQIPDLASLRLRGAELGLPDGRLSLDLEPKPGPFIEALILHLGNELVLPRIPTTVRPHLGIWVDSPGAAHVLFERALGDRLFSVRARANTRLDLDYTPQAIVAKIEPPLDLLVDGSLEFLPNLEVSGVRYSLTDGSVELVTSPEVGALEQTVLSAAVLLASPMMPAVIRPSKPTPRTPPPDLEKTHARVLLSRATPAGPVAVRLAESDQLTVRLTPTCVEVTSAQHIVVHAPIFGLAIEFSRATVDLQTGKVALDLNPQSGDLVADVVSSLVRRLALEQLRRLLPAEPKAGEPWVLRTVELRPGEQLSLSLPPEGSLTVVRTTNHLTLRAERGLRVTTDASLPTPEFSVHELDWDLANNKFSVTTSPRVGPLTQQLTNRLLDRLIPAAFTQWLTYLGLPKPPERTAKSPPPLHGPIVVEHTVPQLGATRVALDLDHSARVAVSREFIELTFGRGLTLRSLSLDFTVKLVCARLNLATRSLDVATEPALGDLEHQILRRAAGKFLEHVLTNILPDNAANTDEYEVVLTVGRQSPAGPIHVCLPPGRNFEFALDKKGCGLRSTAGIRLRGNPEVLSWLPAFSLHELRYAFASGDMSIDISGIEERYYHEEDDVSPITEAICAHLFRLFVGPRVPALTERLGFVRHPAPPEIQLPSDRIGLFAGEVGAIGALFITMDPDDTLTIRASGEEVSINCLLGLQLAMPKLRLQLEIRHARYHPQSGEVQLGGLGQLENAIIEGVLRKRFAAKKPDSGTLEPLGAMLENLPITPDGKRKLYESSVVTLYMHPKARFTVRCGAEGLELLADPPITVDGPSIVDYHFEGLTFEFSEGKFHVEMANEGKVPDILTDILISKIEKKLGQLFLPLLPAPMRKRSYNLAEDPNSVETIATLFANVSSAKTKRG